MTVERRWSVSNTCGTGFAVWSHHERRVVSRHKTFRAAQKKAKALTESNIIKTPFKDKEKARQFEAMVKAYDTRHKDLIRPDGNRCEGNGWASSFWKGYDPDYAAMWSPRWDRGSKNTIGYICWRAGIAVRKRELSIGNKLIPRPHNQPPMKEY